MKSFFTYIKYILGVKMSKQKVLVVDDEEPIQNILKAILENEDFHVLQARALAEGRDVFDINKNEIHVIFMDGKLKDGYSDQFVEEIRQAGFTNPIIAFSGNEDNQKRLIELGCSHRIDSKGAVDDFLGEFKKIVNSKK
jgi:CheY-like chemotaxis protein